MNGDNLGTIRGCGHTVCMHTTVDTLLTRDARKTKEIKAYVPANIELYLDVKTMSTMPVLYIVDVHGNQSPFPGSPVIPKHCKSSVVQNYFFKLWNFFYYWTKMHTGPSPTWKS